MGVPRQVAGEVFAAYLRRHGRPDAADTDTEYGPPGKSMASSPSLHPFTQTTVNYSDRTWSRGTQLTGLASGSPGTACELVKGMTDPLLAGEVFFASLSFIHAALACGGLSVTGRMHVDGATAIKLTGIQRLAKLPITLYISPATYLPIRIVTGGLRQDYRWRTDRGQPGHAESPHSAPVPPRQQRNRAVYLSQQAAGEWRYEARRAW